MKLYLVLSIVCLAIACNVMQTQEPTALVAKYDFTPPEKAQVKEHDVAFILIRPQFAKSFTHSTARIFADFSDNMGKDFEELLVARGYTLRGPYESMDEIIYQDKIETDLTLEIEINVDIVPDAGAIKSYYSYAYKRNLYHLDGQVSITGYVNMIVYEAFSKEKLYPKKISIEPIQIPVKSFKKYFDTNIPVTDVGVNNALVPVMEQAYEKLLRKAWDHLHPGEIVPLKDQVVKLRERRKY